MWATNTKLTNRHLWPTIEKARANGAAHRRDRPDPHPHREAIDVERGDQFIQPLPGTDIAMMLAMMHVIIRDGLTNDDWVDAHTLGFDELARPRRRLDTRRGPRDQSGVDADVIEALAVDYATTRPGRRSARSSAPSTTRTGRCSSAPSAACPALTGAWRDRGGGIAKSVGSYSDALDRRRRALFRPDLEARPDGREPRTLNMSRLGDDPHGPACRPEPTVPACMHSWCGTATRS